MEVYKYQKALVIDDSDMDLLVNQTILRTIKFAREIVTRNTGKEAITYLRQIIADPNDPLPDFILLDINMPIMNGFEFLEQFETIVEAGNKCKIAVITSSEDLEDIQKVSSFKSVVGYLVKPLDIDSLNRF